MWESLLRNFKAYLQLERSLSGNSIEAYCHDVTKLWEYLQIANERLSPIQVSDKQVFNFMYYLANLGLEPRSQARILSGLKAFYKFLLLENLIEADPTTGIESPKLAMKLPDTLSFIEIEKMLAVIDLSLPESPRNRAMLEILYGCGLRVSELIQLKLSECYFDIGFIRILGKGNKVRLVPISPDAMKYTTSYIEHTRKYQSIKKEAENTVFLNMRGGGLSRVWVFQVIKQVALLAGIQKNISPHTFRHSFATHLIEGGADLRAVQEMLGHESITSTEIYTHLNSDYLRQTLIDFHPRSQKKVTSVQKLP